MPISIMGVTLWDANVHNVKPINIFKHIINSFLYMIDTYAEVDYVRNFIYFSNTTHDW